MTSIPLVQSKAHSCSYLDGQTAQSLFVYPGFPLQTWVYAQLIEQGFRRSGDDVYRPQCPNCAACMPARIAVADFKANRNQHRCLKKNLQTQAIIKPPVFEQPHYDMYLRYQQCRHADGDMATSSADDYINFLGSTWCDTCFVEFWIDGELAGMAVVDQLDNALSAVYTFFEPKFASASLGVYAVLWQIGYAKQQHKEFVYLGYWIKDCLKMTYKSNYQPLQLLLENHWT